MSGGKRENGLNLKESRFRFGIRKKFYIGRWNRLLREMRLPHSWKCVRPGWMEP